MRCMTECITIVNSFESKQNAIKVNSTENHNSLNVKDKIEGEGKKNIDLSSFLSHKLIPLDTTMIVHEYR